MSISSVLVANRGEIAVRIVRAARQLGIRSVQAYSSADANSLAVMLADEAIEIGPSPASKSYLDCSAVIGAAERAGVDAVHPGYGFLSENAGFAEQLEACGLRFIGPSAETIRLMGDKVSARETAAKASVPIIPGSIGCLSDEKEACQIAEGIGYPVLIKATAGGGGRGIRFAENRAELERSFHQAASEAKAAFGDDRLYLEKAISSGRHVEVQLLGDGKRAIHLFERDCSLQRRRQKVWEEAPAPNFPEDVRVAMCSAAVRLAEFVEYRGVGTVEFLYDDVEKRFYFMEMNTRIQVEHPVTECVTGVDLVEEMFRVASGEPLRFTQKDIRLRGHSIEVRINAEDPSRNFLPSPGKVGRMRLPGGPGVRFDSHIFEGYTVPPYYDSLLGKLIVWGEDRPAALRRLASALHELEVTNIKTTSSLFSELLTESDITEGQFDIGWLERWLSASGTKSCAATS